MDFTSPSAFCAFAMTVLASCALAIPLRNPRLTTATESFVNTASPLINLWNRWNVPVLNILYPPEPRRARPQPGQMLRHNVRHGLRLPLHDSGYGLLGRRSGLVPVPVCRQSSPAETGLPAADSGAEAV